MKICPNQGTSFEISQENLMFPREKVTYKGSKKSELLWTSQQHWKLKYRLIPSQF